MTDKEIFNLLHDHKVPAAYITPSLVFAIKEMEEKSGIKFSEWCALNYTYSLDGDGWYDNEIRNKYSTEELYKLYQDQNKK